ncbi:Superkiller protein 3 [Podila verticillata]|nr:Superkiller protein 3 [Podila verticillata]
MSTVKVNLKNAREAIGNKNYDDAVKWCQKVLDWESNNYNALVFLGVAYQNLGDAVKGEESFKKAIQSNPELPLARQGLINFYEKLERWNDLIPALEEMLQTHLATPDGRKAQAITEQLIKLYTQQDQVDKAIEKMQTLLPGSKLYEILEDKPNQIETLRKLVVVQEQADSDYTERELKLRRGRINSGTAAQLQVAVRNDMYSRSEVGTTYELIISLDPENNKDLESKLLEFYLNKMIAVTSDKKSAVREKALKLASSMVDYDSDSYVPYETLLRFVDASSPSNYDADLQGRFSTKFPERGLSKLIQGQQYIEAGDVSEEVMEIIEEGFGAEPAFPYGYLVLCWMSHANGDFEVGLEHAAGGRDIVKKEILDTGFPFTRMLHSFELCLANCQLKLDPKAASYSLELYLGILKADDKNIEAHQGVGFAYSAQEKYDAAAHSFERVLQLDPDNVVAKSEIGWIHYLQGQYEEAEAKLREAVQTTESPRAVDMYRLGRIYYDMGDDYRENPEYSYAQLIAAVKLDQSCAGAFCYLGHYYREVIKDGPRAKKCYERAFSLDPREGEAGLHLSDYLLDGGDTEYAVDVFRKATTADRKANWAWKRLGFSELTGSNYLDAIGSFQKLLRNDVKDPEAWLGLAEAYQHEGRHMASLKALKRAQELLPNSPVVTYQIADVYQNLTMYPEAIEYYQTTLDLSEGTKEAEYMLSFMGIAQSNLKLAREYFDLGYYGRTAECSGNALMFASQLLAEDGQIRAAWKLVGDACLVYRSVPRYLHLCPLAVLCSIDSLLPADTNQSLHFPEKFDHGAIETMRSGGFGDLYNATTETSSQALEALYTVAGMAYKRANVLSGNQGIMAANYWYDIGLTYYYRHENATRKKRTANSGEASQWLGAALHCLKASLQFEEENATVWNALGVASFASNPKISQHGFIKSIEYDSKNPAPWSNLGYLYLLNSELDLALNAFTMAQTLDPAFAQAWTGQAWVANQWASSESTALFAHACESSSASILEANYGFASNTFTDMLANSNKSSSKDSGSTSLLVTPAFALTKYLEQRPRDTTAWNLLGLIRERFAQQAEAAECFLTAIKIMDEEENEASEGYQRRKMVLHHNLGRSLLSIQDYAGAIQAYEISLELEGVDAPASVFRTCKHLGAGLALYYAGELERSLQMFEVALAETEQVEGLEKSRDDVIVLLSQVLWALGGDEQRAVAKDELLRCISQSPNHLPAIFGLSAMGLVQNDETLATAAVKEVLKFSRQDLAELDPELKSDKLVSQYYSLLSEPKQAISVLSRSVHQAPSEALLWKRLSEHISSTVGTTGAATYAASVANARAAVALLPQQDTLQAIDLSQGYAQLAGTILLADGERQRQVSGWKNPKKDKIDEENRKSQAKVREAVSMAQRAVLAAPWNREAWQVVGFSVQKLEL